ncbi:hypothetical protein JRG66_01155 [Salinimicrobium tongyeongense]|uniref:Glycosyl transferase family 11 n=1 Tax=Salinimicrobium tongyeongense TaxID=2809707 RepID=A0ABY6NRK1_9FLAO|nr:hypothetical protein [Salinimicrobium tongyeongense]UZH55534.1 hypothetical protein JRG66_01155 [Salinimicrobium tongyeongense]
MEKLNHTEKLRRYKELNNSFEEKLTFHFGANAGFFSEFNNMVFAILYCLQNKIDFRLYSKRGNLAYNKGWQDFFSPFCEETEFYLHSRYNRRAYQMERAKAFPPALLRIISGNRYLTQDIWDKFRSRKFELETFNIPELEIINETLPRAAQTIIQMIWNYNEPAKTYINKFKASVSLPERYLSIHIRAGDKTKESKIFNTESYMGEAEKLGISENIFVLTDDYRLLRELKIKYPAWNFFTLCHPSEEGYVHNEFLKLSKKEKYLKLLKLLASIDLCAASEHFIGTFSSGPGNYLGMRMGEEKCTGIDYKSWLLW